jgi:hypothetical protein
LGALQKLQIRVVAVEVGSILRGRKENGVGVKERRKKSAWEGGAHADIALADVEKSVR